MTDATEPDENELFKIYVQEGICDALPFKHSLGGGIPASGYHAALRIWRLRNTPPARAAIKEGE